MLRRRSLQPCHGVWELYPGMLLLPYAKLLVFAPECCFAFTVVFDVVFPEHDSPFACFEMFGKLGVFQTAENHEGCEMNRSPVFLRLWNYF